MFEKLINRYQLSKTLRFSLIPVGKTEENFNNRLLLDEDEERAENYEKVKKYIDRYHKYFIESVLSNYRLDGVDEYASLYFKANKDDKDIKVMADTEKALRTKISKVLKNDQRYKDYLSKNAPLIRTALPEFLTDKEELEIVNGFRDFTTYFTGFMQNRENMYTADEQSTGIAYRCINDNLPKFLDNVKNFEKIAASFPQENLDELNQNFEGVYNIDAQDMFTVDAFSFVLAQSGIDKYNNLIGGYSNSDGSKVKGINEYINLYNQQVAKNDKSARLPLLKPLYKQILSDRDSISFIPESFENDNELLKTVEEFYNGEYGAKESLEKAKNIVCKIDEYDNNGIYLSAGLAISDISNAVFGSWSFISNKWNAEYEAAHKIGRNPEKFYENEKKEYKKIKSFSLAELQRLGGDTGDIAAYYREKSNELWENIESAYNIAKPLLTNEYREKKRLSKNAAAVEKIKNFLDAIKDFENLVKPLCASGKEENKDDLFYGEFLGYFDEIKGVDALYNKVRNYLTKKPYSTDKIKLNFQNPQFLGGWDRNKERDYRCVLMKRGNDYFLAVMDKSDNKIFEHAYEDTNNSDNNFDKMNYKLLPDPSKMLPKVFFSKKNLEYYSPSDEILEIREKGSFKKGSDFDLDSCRKFIDFYKQSIEKHPDWQKFNFKFSDTDKYADISQFYKEVSEQGYSITYSKVSCDYIKEMIDSGKLYLFQIYNKDFSKYSHGTPNLHTLYFKMLFDERNLSDVVYKLSGGAEMFYRKASIANEEKIVHPANQPIDNKNPENKKKQSVFEYELVKDKRFTKRQFSLHIPITLNFKAGGNGVVNDIVNDELRGSKDNYVIGIDRGERNLIYICVVNGKGEIVEQTSLNEIVSDNGYTVNYQKLLDSRESERDKARKSWNTIGNIKELKEGYISQVVHKICELAVKYNAVITMEDLNYGFMNSRKKVEKQVYQKFERSLTTKLNYLADKKLDPAADGGLLRAYQLTNKADKLRKGKQDGIIFYIPAWLTSKIDPVTGFVSLIRPKYTSVAATKDFFAKFDNISYSESDDMFVFDTDYDKFPKCAADFKKKWKIYTNGDRIKTFRNPEKNSEWDNVRVNLTAEFKRLFEKYEIDYRSDLKEKILSQNSKDFFVELTHLFALTLQMRNSVTGNTDIDYLVSPVKDNNGEFYDSRKYDKNSALPCDADANGAYNIARKGLWTVEQIRNAHADEKIKPISNKEWLEYAQTNGEL